jgi:outer membrane protein OmpA-like peptidoglycan-associated protein
VYGARRNQKGKWNFAYPLAGLSELHRNEAPLSISADGTSLVIFNNGVLNETHKTIHGWSEPKNISENINSAVWQGTASLSPNGRVLIYESQRDDVLGYNSYRAGNLDYQNIDLFISFTDSIGNWSQGLNLGTIINTFQSERSPYLHADMKTLYFSSEGRGGLGMLDVFKTTRLDDTWLNWSEPQNVGKQINTSGADWGYVVSSTNVLGYFSANGDIKCITPLPKLAKATDVAVVKGILTDGKGRRVTAGKVIVRDMETNIIYMECNVDPDSGSYQMALPPGGRYSLEIVQKNSLPQFDTIDTRQVTHYIERNIETRKIISFQEMKEQNIAVPLNNLFFNTGEAIIRPDSYLELDNLAKLIKENSWQLEILGHTDNAGSAEMNKKLSEARAAAVKAYLLGKGCTAAAIKTAGYGATKPIADNKDELGRAKNRRVEIKIR